MIDTHQHFWHYNPEEYGWISEDMKALKRDFLPEDLKPLLDKMHFEGTVAVQARQTLEETEWLLQLAGQYEWIKGVVGWVDLCSDEVEAQLQRFNQHPKLVGIRHVLHDEPDGQFMLRDDFLAGVEKLKGFDLTYDILIFEKHLPTTIEFVKKFPTHRFVLEHIAKPKIQDNVLSPWDQNIQKLSQFDNVYCKLSGMVTEADWNRWTPNQFTQYMDVVLESFGIDRILLGSDWPVCTLAGTYEQVISIPMRYMRFFTDSEKAKFENENAKRVYQLL